MSSSRIQVLLPSPLRSYTEGREAVEAAGNTLVEVLDDLDRQFPGIRFRMIDEQGATRPHMKFFINRELTRDLSHALVEGDELLVVAALSGG